VLLRRNQRQLVRKPKQPRFLLPLLMQCSWRTWRRRWDRVVLSGWRSKDYFIWTSCCNSEGLLQHLSHVRVRATCYGDSYQVCGNMIWGFGSQAALGPCEIKGWCFRNRVDQITKLCIERLIATNVSKLPSCTQFHFQINHAKILPYFASRLVPIFLGHPSCAFIVTLFYRLPWL